MIAMALIEWLQTRRVVLRQFLFLVGLCLAARYIAGGVAAIGALLVVPVNVASTVGLGTFSEELTRGQYRFLHTLPFSRATIFGVKVVNGFLFSCVLTSAIIATVLLAPGPFDTQLLDVRTPAVLVPVLLAIAALCIFNFSTGLLASLMCKSQRNASLVATVLGYGLVFGLGAKFLHDRDMGRVGALLALLPVAAVGMIATAWSVFLIRNPFVDEASRWNLRGGLGAGLTVGATILLFPLVPSLGPPAGPGEVGAFHVAPGGHAVLIQLQTKLGKPYGVVVDREGAELGPLLPYSAVPPEALWRPGEKLQLLGFEEPDPFGGGPTSMGLRLVDARSGEMQALEVNRGVPGGSIFMPVRWSRDGNTLLGLTHVVDPPGQQIIRYDMRTGTSSLVQLAAEGTRSVSAIGGQLFARESAGRDNRIALIDDEGVAGPAHPMARTSMGAVQSSADGRRIVFVRRAGSRRSSAKEVVEIDMSSGGERVLVSASVLSDVLATAVADDEDDVDEYALRLVPVLSPSGHLLVAATALDEMSWYLVQDGKLTRLPLSSWSVPRFSPDGSSLLFTRFDPEVMRQTLEIVRLEPVPGEVVLTQEVLGEPQWLDARTVLLLDAVGDDDGVDYKRPRGRLWKLDVSTGVRSLFYPRPASASGDQG